MEAETAKSIVEEKEWVSHDEWIEVPPNFDAGSSTVKWVSGSYIPSVSLQRAVDDDDVEVCNVESEDGNPVVYLEVCGDRDDWPMQVHDELASLAHTRFRQHDHRPGWHMETPESMLKEAERNLENARFVDRDDELTMKEEMADAMNYILFAFDLLE